MPGQAPGMMLLGRLSCDPGMVFGIDSLDRQHHEGRRRIGVELFNGLSQRLGHRNAALDQHHDLLSPLDFSPPPVMRNHARQDIDASCEPPLHDRPPCPLRLDN